MIFFSLLSIWGPLEKDATPSSLFNSVNQARCPCKLLYSLSLSIALQTQTHICTSQPSKPHLTIYKTIIMNMGFTLFSFWPFFFFFIYISSSCYSLFFILTQLLLGAKGVIFQIRGWAPLPIMMELGYLNQGQPSRGTTPLVTLPLLLSTLVFFSTFTHAFSSSVFPVS